MLHNQIFFLSFKTPHYVVSGLDDFAPTDLSVMTSAVDNLNNHCL